MTVAQHSRALRRGPLRVVLIYAVFASLWILFSDQIVGALASDPQIIVEVSIVKGVAFVLVTAALLYGLVSRLVHQIERAHQLAATAESGRRQMVQLLSAASASSGDAMFAKDTEGRYLIINDAACRLVGKTAEEIIGKDDRALFPDAQAAELIEINRRIVAEGQVFTYEEELPMPDGPHAFLATKGPLRDKNGKIFGTFGISHDITQRKQAEQALRESEERLQLFVEHAPAALAMFDREMRYLAVSQRWLEDYGLVGRYVIGTSHYDSFPTIPEAWKDAHRRGLAGEVTEVDEDYMARPDGSIQWLHWVVRPWHAHDGRIGGIVIFSEDITHRKLAEETIHSLSFYDALTALPNRRLMMDRLQRILESKEMAGARGAVMFIDLDDFSALNDTRGHRIGDLALIEVAGRIRASLPDDNLVARHSGDEFVAIIEHLDDDAEQAALQARTIAERIQAAIRQPMTLAGNEHQLTASIGISLFRNGSTHVDDLLKRADASMYQGNRNTREHVGFFDAAMQVALEARVSLENSLRRAIPEQLRAYYQPQVDADGRITGAEVLVRWLHPQDGIIYPGAFIPLAEETGLILPIGEWVLKQACRQLKLWQASQATRHLRLAVNVSGVQFQRDDFVGQVLAIVEAEGIDPTGLKLELTESMLIKDAETVIAKMAALKTGGIRFSLDDFGTGYSSLSYLRRMSLDQLKIDQSFVRDVDTNANDAAIVRTIIALGQALGLSVIAEGVETEAQRNFLAVHGCMQYQGYLFGRPTPIDEFEKRLTAG